MTSAAVPNDSIDDLVLDLLCDGCGHEVEAHDQHAEVGLCRQCGVAFLVEPRAERRAG